MKLYNVVASHRVPSIRSRKSKDVSLKFKMIVRVKFKNMLIISVKVINKQSCKTCGKLADSDRW